MAEIIELGPERTRRSHECLRLADRSETKRILDEIPRVEAALRSLKSRRAALIRQYRRIAFGDHLPEPDEEAG